MTDGSLLRETVEEAKPEAVLDAQLPHALSSTLLRLYVSNRAYLIEN
jgi:hypothetical protein